MSMKQMMVSAALLCAYAWADVTTTKADGGSVAIAWGNEKFVNANSTLRREWVAVHDDRLPVDIVGTPGVTTTVNEGRGSREGRGSHLFEYRAEYTISVSEPVAAVEVKFILFDVWGIRTKTLSATVVEDFGEGEHNLNEAWRVFPDNEVIEHYASIGYISAVRTKAGAIFTADTAAVVDVAREHMDDFTDDLLETDPPIE